MFDWWHNLGLSEPVITLRKMLLEDGWEASTTNPVVPCSYYTTCTLSSKKHKMSFTFIKSHSYETYTVGNRPWMTPKEARVIGELMAKRWNDLYKAEQKALHKQQRAEFAKSIGAPDGNV